MAGVPSDYRWCVRRRVVWLFAVVSVALFAAAAVVLTITAADALRPWLAQIEELVGLLGEGGVK